MGENKKIKLPYPPAKITDKMIKEIIREGKELTELLEKLTKDIDKVDMFKRKWLEQ